MEQDVAGYRRVAGVEIGGGESRHVKDSNGWRVRTYAACEFGAGNAPWQHEIGQQNVDRVAELCAMTARQLDPIETRSNELSDLLFYLEDA